LLDKADSRSNTKVTGPKYQISKIQDADGRHFENGFIATYQPEIIRFQRNLGCRRRLLLQDQLLTKYQNHTNSK